MQPSSPSPLKRAIEVAKGRTNLMLALRERGHDIKAPATIYQWEQQEAAGRGVPAKYCPDIEALTGIPCEELNPETNWAVLRKQPRKAKRAMADQGT